MNGKRKSSLVRRGETLVPDQYGSGALMSGFDPHGLDRGDIPCGISLHDYPLDIVDYLGHYFLPVEKAT